VYNIYTQDNYLLSTIRGEIECLIPGKIQAVLKSYA